MARIYDKKIDKHVKWSGDRNTDFLPVKGDRVEEFIKESLEARIGALYYDTANNRYLAFADNENRDKYLADPTQVQLILGTFDAPFNYSAEINLLTPSYNAVFLGAKGNSIQFTFDVKNKQGASTGENVIIQYTIIRNAVKKVVTATGKAGETITFPVDEYLGEGTNTIIVGITGQTSLAATTSAVTYQVVNLSLSDETDIAIPYDLSTGSKIAEVSFSVSGYGTKVVEWYLDGELIPFVKSEDEVVENATTRTKYLQLSNLQQGTHSLQIRAYTTINGERFYSDTLYRELIVTTGADKNTIVAVGYTIPAAYGLADESLTLYGAIQYLPYTFRLAAYSPKNLSEIPITITIDGVNKGVVVASNNIEESFTFTSAKDGNQTVVLSTEGVTRQLTVQVARTTMKITEITAGLALDFNAMGKSNTAADRAQWTGNGHTATLEGFNWNETSGWVDNLLKMNSGASLSIDYAPLGNNPTELGKTIEMEFRSTNVTDDNAVLCDLRDNGVGLLITATKVALTSQNGTIIETEYKSEEFVRIAFVINRSAGSARKNLTFIYANGCVSRCQNWASTDSYTSPVELLLQATEGAEIELKSIRIYDAALNDDQILNNYTLYRDTIEDMVEIYNRNDIYAEGTVAFAPDKMVSRLPVMIVTGDIPTLENTSDKDTQIVVDIEYNNLQDPKKSFKMVGAAMRPQGTSSMGYPKKNFRIYTNKLADTILYDADGNTVADKLYSFKDNAIPVDCWCLKADYAESSGTHNTGIARMWNKALMDGQIDGEYVFRTDAQKAAIAAGYKYDVRTTIDGFPILLFYRPTAGDEPIFIGKYNFNNDKSTENVFGFTGIPGFDNSRMQCWEVLNNGNPIGLFTDIDDFYRTVQSEDGLVEGWQLAFEARYPDKSTDTLDLYDFAQWVNGIKDDHTRFATEKWLHLNVYMMAAYYCYLMRHAAADQFVKNAMLTSEDGQHFYFILYDNDTINGLINTGAIDIEPTDDRQTLDKSGTYKFAGHDSVLWNMLEADEEFMNLVKTVDNALYSVGISYTNAIRMFDQEQADKWVERVYNQDSEYKYVGPYSNQGINNLFMLQGKRDLHRRWWLAKRFSIYDAKFVSGEYKSQAIELKCQNGTEPGLQMIVTAGYPLDYGYGINNLPRKSGVTLNAGESTTFVTEETVNLGDPIRIYGAPNIAELDISQMVDRLAVVTIANVYAPALGTKLRKLIIGNPNKQNLEVSEISGLTNATLLEYLDIRNMKGMTSLNLTHQKAIKYVDATGSSVASIEFAKGATLETLKLPTAIQTLVLDQLPYLSDLTSENNLMTVRGLTIKNCPALSNDFNFIYNWRTNTQLGAENLTLEMTDVMWANVNPAQLITLGDIKSLKLKGKIHVTAVTQEQVDELSRIFGSSCFDKNAELQIVAPDGLFLSGPNELKGDNTIELGVAIFSDNPGRVEWSITSGTSYAAIQSTGDLTANLIGKDYSNDGTITVQAKHIPTSGDITYATKTIAYKKYIRVTSGSISGPATMGGKGEFIFNPSPTNYEKPYTVSWSLTGDAATAGYVTITEQNNDSCKVSVTERVSQSTFQVVAKVTNDKGSSFTRTYSVTLGVTFTLQILSNQPNDDTIAAVQATVYYGSKYKQLSNGQSIGVVAGTTVKVAFSPVTGYKTPSTIEFVVGDDDVTRIGTYLTELVEVTLSATDGRDLTGITVKINSTQYTWNGTPIKAKIAFDTSYTIAFSHIAGCFTPTMQDIIASQVTRMIIGAYEPIPEGLVVIDQTITDPATMVYGDINSSVIQQIRAESHRYLGKYTSDGQMTLCQLADDNSTMYVDGTPADLTGSQGDVFMKMPDFWYRAVEVRTDIWGIQFQLGSTSPGDGWIKWDTNALIGVYEAYIFGNKVYSRSGVSSSAGTSQQTFKRLARNRGNGFQLVDWQMHCVMAILFYAQYGHTNCQKKIGAGTDSYTKPCGQTNANGMNDTKGIEPVDGLNDAGADGNTQSINFWGLENWWGNKYEWIDNVVVDAYEWKITEPDGTLRTPGFAIRSSYSWIKKLMFGDNCDLIPTTSGSSNSTGFCDYYSGSSATACVVNRAGAFSGADCGVAFVDASRNSSYTNTSWGSRLAFRGQCAIEEDTNVFKSLTAIE